MPQPTPNPWNKIERVSFRFSFIFLCSFVFIHNPVLPLAGFMGKVLDRAVIWLSNSVLELNYIIPTIRRGGSGDTLYHYITLLLILIISILGATFWSWLDRKKKQYFNLHYWLLAIVRYYLALTFIHYGLVKVIKLQFSSPDLTRLLTPYGDSSPMGLAWTFFGFSDGYNIFIGICELFAALLFFRRTATLGALICIAVSANIMAINYFFDVPVKILSTMLFVMSLFLLVPNFKQLFKFFLSNEAVQLKEIERPLLSKKWVNTSIAIFKYLIIIAPITFLIFSNINQRKHYGDGAPKLPLYGVYKVESFESERPVTKWEELAIQRSEHSIIRMLGEKLEFCNMTVDTSKHELTIAFKDDPVTFHRFKYTLRDPDNLDLHGIYFDQSLKVKLVKQHFQLVERSFNWVSEEPYNR
ncbi:hypothetical protein [Desertivirga brevis]|uniref:hypothetical protein n=1 Tax=Desertivirga brevis TaxID=2810310 RepID=UPI001A95DDAF|nr:hypothetical protein [Pedobacter sp. SYSU D00873]